jgi:arylsulfatase A-like enzyme
MRYFSLAALTTSLFVAGPASAASQHNVVIFVPDGLRAGMVTPERAPTMAALRDGGVTFPNSHSLFPTFTTTNAATLATGHLPGDTGDFGNNIYTAFPVSGAGRSVTPFLESDPVLGEVDKHFAGDYLHETTLLALARAAGFDTAAIGKVGPTLIFDHTERSGLKTIMVDDQTGSENGIPLAPWLKAAIAEAGLPATAPDRGKNGEAGDAQTRGTLIANVGQQDWFVSVLTRIVLPHFKQDGKPFVVVFWSRDPDGTQHNQGDSLGQLTPGINGPTSLAAIRNADDDLARIRAALRELGFGETTDVIISADHGFSTISKQSDTSDAAQVRYAGVPPGALPPGFLAIDIAHSLSMKLFDPDQDGRAVPLGSFPSRANGLIGDDPARPAVVVAANGGSDLIYLPKPAPPSLAKRIIEVLLKQDYVGGLFVDDRLGRFPGALPLSVIGIKGSAVTPLPDIVVSFRTWSTGCADKALCEVDIADTTLQQGQGMHGSFGRGDTRNFMAAIGPDFKRGFVDPAPVGNADVGRTVARILGLKLKNKGKLTGRVLVEALAGGKPVTSTTNTVRSAPDPMGLATEVRLQTVGQTRYFDTAGIPARTVGLEP